MRTRYHFLTFTFISFTILIVLIWYVIALKPLIANVLFIHKIAIQHIKLILVSCLFLLFSNFSLLSVTVLGYMPRRSVLGSFWDALSGDTCWDACYASIFFLSHSNSLLLCKTFLLLVSLVELTSYSLPFFRQQTSSFTCSFSNFYRCNLRINLVVKIDIFLWYTD